MGNGGGVEIPTFDPQASGDLDISVAPVDGDFSWEPPPRPRPSSRRSWIMGKRLPALDLNRGPDGRCPTTFGPPS